MSKTKWTGKGGASWFDAANWTRGVPAAQAAALFSDGGAWSISLAGPADATAGSMTVLGDALTFGHGTLDLSAPQSSGYPIDLAVGGGGSVTLSAGATLTSHDIIDVGRNAGGALTGGSMTVHGVLDGAFFDVIDGRATIAGRGAHVALLYDGYSASISDGSLAIMGGGTLDAGPDSLGNQYSELSIGGGSADGRVSVAGAGSSLTLSGIYFSGVGQSALTVSSGGSVHVNSISTLGYGGVDVAVSGAGSSLMAERAISIGDDQSLSGLSLTVTGGASVSAGTYGVALRYAALLLDAASHLDSAFIYSQASSIGAEASSHTAPGTVHVTSQITLDANLGAQGQYDYITRVFSSDGAVLSLDGQISSDNTANLQASSGTVVLDNAGNTYNSTSIYAALLDVAVTGAAGNGMMSFVGGPSQSAVLQIDAGVDFANTIAGFAGQDTIDLRGFAFGAGTTDIFAGGTLTLSNGGGSTSLSFSGPYAASSFALASDQHGGTVIAFAHGQA